MLHTARNSKPTKHSVPCGNISTVNIFESGPMPIAKLQNFLAGPPLLQSCNGVKTMPKLTGNQIPFGGTRLGFV